MIISSKSLCVVAGALFQASLLAAIVTRQNNVYTRPPDYATFGTNSNGIASQWIPYGTYTEGYGRTEYLRVTSNLIGVVASVFDGYDERVYVPSELLPEALYSVNIYYPPPASGLSQFRDNGAYLLSTTNNTTRILDALNATSFLSYHVYSSGTNRYAYSVSGRENIESRLATTSCRPGVDDFFENDGLSASFASRRLDDLVGDIDPPISTTWSTAIPFQLSDLSQWVRCWPTYAALTNDLHFYPVPAMTGLVHRCSRPFMDWMMPAHVSDAWGADVNSNALDVVTNAELRCLSLRMEDVLKDDPGWKYEVPPIETNSWWDVSGPLGNWRLELTGEGVWDGEGGSNYLAMLIFYNALINPYYEFTVNDLETYELPVYAIIDASASADELHAAGYDLVRTRLFANQDDFVHWRNMTTRLDWMRLGILCQLESQMESTYRPRVGEDYLPFSKESYHAKKIYVGELEVPMLDPHGGILSTTNFTTASVQWTLATNRMEVTTNDLYRCFPTVRIAPTRINGSVYTTTNVVLVNAFASASTFAALFESMAEDIVAAFDLGKGALLMEPHGRMAVDLDGRSGFEWSWDLNYVVFYAEGSIEPEYLPVHMSGWQAFHVSDAHLPSNVVIGLELDIEKDAQLRHTLPIQSANQFDYLEIYPDSNVWERAYVYSQERPTLEFMIDAQGSDIYSLAMSDDNDLLSWGAISAITNIEKRRAFRMAPNVSPQRTLNSSCQARITQLNALNAGVENRFAAIAGTSVANAGAYYSSFRNNEERQIIQALSTIPMALSASLRPDVEPGDVYTFVACNIDNDGDVSLSSKSLCWISPSASAVVPFREYQGDYVLGDFALSLSKIATTNLPARSSSVRVDAHQNEMIKTLWRFKNLRRTDL